MRTLHRLILAFADDDAPRPSDYVGAIAFALLVLVAWCWAAAL